MHKMILLVCDEVVVPIVLYQSNTNIPIRPFHTSFSLSYPRIISHKCQRSLIHYIDRYIVLLDLSLLAEIDGGGQ